MARSRRSKVVAKKPARRGSRPAKRPKRARRPAPGRADRPLRAPPSRRRPAVTEDAILALLHDVETGAVRLEREQHPQAVYSGKVGYQASNGWRLILFILGNAWDFLEELTPPGGPTLHRSQLSTMRRLEAYLPAQEVAWKRWSVPGWCTFLCERCEREVRRFSELRPAADGCAVCADCLGAGGSY